MLASCQENSDVLSGNQRPSYISVRGDPGHLHKAGKVIVRCDKQACIIIGLCSEEVSFLTSQPLGDASPSRTTPSAQLHSLSRLLLLLL